MHTVTPGAGGRRALPGRGHHHPLPGRFQVLHTSHCRGHHSGWVLGGTLERFWLPMTDGSFFFSIGTSLPSRISVGNFTETETGNGTCMLALPCPSPNSHTRRFSFCFCMHSVSACSCSLQPSPLLLPSSPQACRRACRTGRAASSCGGWVCRPLAPWTPWPTGWPTPWWATRRGTPHWSSRCRCFSHVLYVFDMMSSMMAGLNWFQGCDTAARWGSRCRCCVILACFCGILYVLYVVPM